MDNDRAPVLALLIPTNRPQVFNEVFLQGVENLYDIRDKILLSFNFQTPWTEQEIKETVSKLIAQGFNVIHKFSKYKIESKGAIPFNLIRNDCTEFLPDNIKYCALCDDDCLFTEGSAEFIYGIIERFKTAPDLGLIQCVNELTKEDGILIYDVDPANQIYMTGNGFYFRRTLISGIFPQDALKNIGVGEENIIGLMLAEQGYRVQMCLYSPMEHYSNYKNLGNVEWYKSSITCGENGNITYVRNKYKSVYDV